LQKINYNPIANYQNDVQQQQHYSTFKNLRVFADYLKIFEGSDKL